MSIFKNNLKNKLESIISGEAPGDHNKAQAILPFIDLIQDEPDAFVREALRRAAPGILASVEAMDNGGRKLSRDEKAEMWDEIEDITASGEGMPEP